MTLRLKCVVYVLTCHDVVISVLELVVGHRGRVRGELFALGKGLQRRVLPVEAGAAVRVQRRHVTDEQVGGDGGAGTGSAVMTIIIRAL